MFFRERAEPQLALGSLMKQKMRKEGLDDDKFTILMIETCARAGNLEVKAWFERYLTAVHFFAGRMKDTVYYYEKSLELPEQERRYLDMHSTGIYADRISAMPKLVP
jgi:hypothetical protein